MDAREELIHTIAEILRKQAPPARPPRSRWHELDQAAYDRAAAAIVDHLASSNTFFYKRGSVMCAPPGEQSERGRGAWWPASGPPEPPTWPGAADNDNAQG